MYESNQFLSNRKNTVQGNYLLPSRKARICRVAGALFLLLAAFTAGGVGVAALLPGVAAACAKVGCTMTNHLADQLPEEDRAKIAASPQAGRKFDAYLARPLVRLGVAGIAALDAAPFALLLLGVGLALRRLGGRGDDPLGKALPWLRRASLAAIVRALLTPFTGSLMAMLLYPGTPAGPHWAITVDFGGISVALALAVAAYAAVWAIEAGVQAQRELAEIV